MQNVIDRTNRFYIEMSRKVLSEKEYDVLQKLLIEKMSLQELAAIYGVTAEYIRQIHERTYLKVKSVTELLAEIDQYKQKLRELKSELKAGTQPVKRKRGIEADRQKLLYNSHFPFSKRMYSMLEALDIQTVRELAEIPLEKFSCFRGFKKQSKTELIAFIEFENIEHLFEGFYAWKKEPLE
jgi:hypothetical protein